MIDKTTGLDKSLKVAQYTLQLLASINKQSQVLPLLAKPISEARVTMRIFDFPVYMVPAIGESLRKLAAKLTHTSSNGSNSSSSSSSNKNTGPTLDVGELVYTWSLVVYYLGEYGYWLGGNKIVPNLDTYWWSRISCRGWLVYLLVEIKSISDTLFQSKLAETKDSSDGKSSSKRLHLSQEDKLKYQMRLLARCCDLVQAYQWSVKEGPFSGLVITLCGLVSGLVDFNNLLKS